MTNQEIFPIIVPNNYGLKTVNFYLVHHGQSLSLIDAGFNDEISWNGLMETLKQNQFVLRDITEIILTHHHIDHVGLVNRITRENPVPVYASPLSIPRLKREKLFLDMRVEFFDKLYREMGSADLGEKHISYLKKSIINNKNQAIQTDILPITEQELFHFHVIDIPGHAPDQLAFLDKEQNLLFAGDLLIEHISSNALVEPDESGQRIPSLIQHTESLKKCHSLNVDVLFSGHGSVIKSPNKLIEMRLSRMEDKLSKILGLIQTGIHTGSELAQTMYRGKYEKEFGLVMSEIIGHLDFLEHRNKVEKERLNGVWHYYAI